MDQETKHYPSDLGPTSDDYNRLVHLRRWGVLPPSALYMELDDFLILKAISPTTAATVNLTLRQLLPNGDLVPQLIQLSVPAGTSTFTTKTIPGVEGWLLSASVETPGALRGQCFVTLEVLRGAGSGDIQLGHVLLQGYAGALGGLAFPQSPLITAVDGRGQMRAVIGGAPAAGAEISDTVPAGRQWILRAARTSLTTSAAVANRDPSLIVDDGAGNIMAQSVDSTLITATQTFALSWAAGFAFVAGAVAISIPWVNECRLLPGWRIRTSTNLIQAGDQYAAPVYMVEELISG